MFNRCNILPSDFTIEINPYFLVTTHSLRNQPSHDDYKIGYTICDEVENWLDKNINDYEFDSVNLYLIFYNIEDTIKYFLKWGYCDYNKVNE